MIRTSILKELKRQGMTPYQLAKKQKGVHTHTCWNYLYSKKDAEFKTIKSMFRVLGLRLQLAVPKGWPPSSLRIGTIESMAKALHLKLSVVSRKK